jgi:hypothetical protein
MTSGWGRQPRPENRRWRPAGPAGCLLWVVMLVLILLVLSVLLGGFQLGTKSAPVPRLPAQRVAPAAKVSTDSRWRHH